MKLPLLVKRGDLIGGHLLERTNQCFQLANPRRAQLCKVLEREKSPHSAGGERGSGIKTKLESTHRGALVLDHVNTWKENRQRSRSPI